MRCCPSCCRPSRHDPPAATHGARPGEVCAMRACDIDMTGDVWLYRPPTHKTRHRGKERVIALGPQAQAVVKPFLKLDLQAYLFSPLDALAEFRAVRRLRRKTPGTAVPANRRKGKPKRRPGDHYTDGRLRPRHRQGVRRLKAGVPRWHPHQLRHTHATEVRRRFGLEAAQVALGHSSAQVTQVYAERDLTLATKVAAEIG